MKKLFLKNAFILALVAFAAILTFSCSKDKDEYKVVVTVKYLSDTLLYVKGADVVIEKNDIRVEGKSDDAGQFMANFDNEAILNISATIDTGSVGNPHMFYGNSTVRLVKNKTVNRTVFINP